MRPLNLRQYYGSSLLLAVAKEHLSTLVLKLFCEQNILK